MVNHFHFPRKQHLKPEVKLGNFNHEKLPRKVTFSISFYMDLLLTFWNNTINLDKRNRDRLKTKKGFFCIIDRYLSLFSGKLR